MGWGSVAEAQLAEKGMRSSRLARSEETTEAAEAAETVVYGM